MTKQAQTILDRVSSRASKQRAENKSLFHRSSGQVQIRNMGGYQNLHKEVGISMCLGGKGTKGTLKQAEKQGH